MVGPAEAKRTAMETVATSRAVEMPYVGGSLAMRGPAVPLRAP
jgi:deoxyinosine 3'endonuclease (endonuclease V)